MDQDPFSKVNKLAEKLPNDGLIPELESSVESKKNFVEKVHDVLRRNDITKPFGILRIRLNMRGEQNLTPLVNPDAISALSQIAEGLEGIIRRPDATIEDIKIELSKQRPILESLFVNIPQVNVVNENIDSLLSAGQAFGEIGQMNLNLIREFEEADDSKNKKESSELNAILLSVNDYLARIINLVNRKLDLLEQYHN